MHCDFGKRHPKEIPNAMVGQFHRDCPEALPAQHAQCAPLIRAHGTDDERHVLEELEAAMVQEELLRAAS